jgi:hypothetical protein
MVIDYKLIRFFAIILFSLMALVIGICGLTGALDRNNQAYYSSLITLVIGVWLKFPRAKTKGSMGALFDQGNSPSDSPIREV